MAWLRACLVGSLLLTAPLFAIVTPSTSADAKGLAKLDEGLAIYLGCGDIQGPGEVVQVDPKGRVLGTVALESTPYGLARCEGGVVAVAPGGGADSIVRIDAQGRKHCLVRTGEIQHPITVAFRPETGEVLVGDNVMDAVLVLAHDAKERPRRLQETHGHDKALDDLSIAWTKDGYLLLGASTPAGAFRFRPGSKSKMGKRLVSPCEFVAADPTSKRWVAAYEQTITVFDGRREVRKMRCPSVAALAFAPQGTLVVASREVAILDTKRRRNAYQPLFSWTKSRVNAIAVAKQMPWSQAKERSPRTDHKEADRLLARGHAFLEAGKLAEALATFRRAVAASPDYGRAYHGLGKALEANGRTKEAAAAFAKAEALGFKPR